MTYSHSSSKHCYLGSLLPWQRNCNACLCAPVVSLKANSRVWLEFMLEVQGEGKHSQEERKGTRKVGGQLTKGSLGQGLQAGTEHSSIRPWRFGPPTPASPTPTPTQRLPRGLGRVC